MALIVFIWSKGKRISGNNATTGIGSASVTHQVIIKPATARTRAACSGTWKGLTKYRNREIASPANKEMNLRWLDKHLKFGIQDTE